MKHLIVNRMLGSLIANKQRKSILDGSKHGEHLLVGDLVYIKEPWRIIDASTENLLTIEYSIDTWLQYYVSVPPKMYIRFSGANFNPRWRLARSLTGELARSFIRIRNIEHIAASNIEDRVFEEEGHIDRQTFTSHWLRRKASVASSKMIIRRISFEVID